MIPAVWSGALSSLKASFDRGHRLARPTHYWRSVEAVFPLTGIPEAELRRRLLAIAEPTDKVVADLAAPLQVLPGLEIEGRTLLYDAQIVDRLTPREGERFRRLGRIALDETEHATWLRRGVAIYGRRRHAVASPQVKLVVVPHNDDAPLAMGGTLALDTDGRDVILNVFTTSGWMGNGYRPRSIEHVTALRAGEEQLSGDLIGASSVSLGLWEIDIRSFHRAACDGYPLHPKFRFGLDPGLRVREEREVILHDLESALELLQPTEIYLPLGVGLHADHLFLREVGLQLLERHPERWAQTTFYEDQPYSTYAAGRAEEMVAQLKSRGIDLVPRLVDVSFTFEAKIQSITAHRSQFARAENEERLRIYAAKLGEQLPNAATTPGRLAERFWKPAASSIAPL